jgi:hypothetical protein
MNILPDHAQRSVVHANAVALLNAPVLTGFGQYELSPISTREAAELFAQRGYFSAVGHSASAELYSRMLRIDCLMHRVRHIQRAGEDAIVLRLGQRLGEHCVLDSVSEIEKFGYSFALLRKLT